VARIHVKPTTSRNARIASHRVGNCQDLRIDESRRRLLDRASNGSVYRSRTVGEVHLLPPGTVGRQPHGGPRCRRRQVRPQDCQGTHVTWCGERGRPFGLLQDLQHESDRSCPWRRRQAPGLQAFCPLYQSAVAGRQAPLDSFNRGPLPQPLRSSLYSCHRPVPPMGRSVQSPSGRSNRLAVGHGGVSQTPGRHAQPTEV